MLRLPQDRSIPAPESILTRERLQGRGADHVAKLPVKLLRASLISTPNPSQQHHGIPRARSHAVAGRLMIPQPESLVNGIISCGGILRITFVVVPLCQVGNT